LQYDFYKRINDIFVFVISDKFSYFVLCIFTTIFLQNKDFLHPSWTPLLFPQRSKPISANTEGGKRRTKPGGADLLCEDPSAPVGMTQVWDMRRFPATL